MSTAEFLRSYASHFAPRDWEYTRQTGIVHIRHREDTEGHNHFTARYRRAFSSLFRKDSLDRFFSPTGWKNKLRYKIAYFKVQARVDNNLPDGALNGGRVITYWEEDGEYIQLVQPSVGILLADFLEAEPTNPHALKIVAEIDRITQGYADRNK